MQINRNIEPQIEDWLFKNKVISIYGARQVGKTTLAKKILKKYNQEANYYDCELIQIKEILERMDLEEIRSYFLPAKIIVFDEAQNVKNIGKILKIIHDHIPEVQIIATGSSSLNFSNETQEPLTGRGIEFILYPFSINEISQIYKNKIELDNRIEDLLVFGAYPEIFNSNYDNKRILLDNISSKYLYKDILNFENIKKPQTIINLLQMIALQLGNEVSTHELAKTLKTSNETINRYLELLEKSFVIFRLKAFSRNLRKEIAKKEKWYFYDLGIRNSLIARYQNINLRDDIGALWENFCIIERMKYRQNNKILGPVYFWRTFDKKEIDYIEEYDGKLHPYEFKWNEKAKFKQPQDFLDNYTTNEVKIINRKNYSSWL